MRVGLLMRTLTLRHARGRGRQHATYRVYVRPIGFTCELSGLRAAQPHRRSHAMSIHAPSEPAPRCVLDRKFCTGYQRLFWTACCPIQNGVSSHIVARLPNLHHYSRHAIARLHAATTAPRPVIHDEAGETQRVTPTSYGHQRAISAQASCGSLSALTRRNDPTLALRSAHPPQGR